jgi:ABC-2 type transport system permease protein
VTAIKHIRLFKEFFRACLIEEFEYRANFAANLLITLFWVLIALLTVKLFFYRATELGGWGFYEVLALLGIFNAIQGFIQFFLQPNMSQLVQHIRTGTLDYVLLKPVDSQFYISFRHLVFWRLADVVIGLGLTAFSVWKLGIVPGLLDLAVFFCLFISALIIVYAIWMGMMVFSFWAVKVDNLSYLFSSIFETARFPIGVYQGILRFILTYLFPIAFITTFPTEAIIGNLSWPHGISTFALAFVFFIAVRLLWKAALRGYTSASS